VADQFSSAPFAVRVVTTPCRLPLQLAIVHFRIRRRTNELMSLAAPCTRSTFLLLWALWLRLRTLLFFRTLGLRLGTAGVRTECLVGIVKDILVDEVLNSNGDRRRGRHTVSTARPIDTATTFDRVAVNLDGLFTTHRAANIVSQTMSLSFSSS